MKFSIDKICYFNPTLNRIALCEKHLANPIPSLTHELCHHDLMKIFFRMGLRFDFDAWGKVTHIMSPCKGIGFGRCAYPGNEWVEEVRMIE